jgi:NOL1/NOP2/fmu family ribosome biogenesis protein
MNVRFIKSKEKKKIVEQLSEIYGIEELNYLLIETGKRKIRAYSGHLSKEELSQLGNLVNVEIIGTYLINTRDEDPRLNFDVISLLRDKITKNIIEIDKKQLEKWIRGHDLDIPNIPRGQVILKFDGELIGVGKSNEEKIFNYVPKERKLKTPLPN